MEREPTADRVKREETQPGLADATYTTSIGVADDDDAVRSNRPLSRTNSGVSGISGRIRPTRTVSKLRYLAVRRSAVSAIFYPQYDHKRTIMEHHLSKTGVTEGEFDSSKLDIRGKIVWLIHSRTIQTILLLLLVCDVCIVIAELIIGSFRHCELHVEAEEHSLCNPTAIALWAAGEVRNYNGTFARNAWHNESGVFPPPFCGVSSRLELSHALHEATIVLFWISTAILIVFAVELVTLFLCLCHRFFTFLYVIDTIIIGVSLLLSFLIPHEDANNTAASIIIFLRCWRFARILHGFGLTVHEVEDVEGLAEAKREGQELQQELAEQGKTLSKAEIECHELKMVLRELMAHESAKEAFRKPMIRHPQLFQKLGDEWEAKEQSREPVE